MTNEQKIVMQKLDPQSRKRYRWIVAYEQIGKVTPVCRYFGVSRSTFYVWYHRYLSFGVEGLQDRSTRPHKISNQIPADIVRTIVTLRKQRKYGPKRMSYHLKEQYNWYISKRLYGGYTKNMD